MQDNETYNNIESIIDKVSKESKLTISFKKFDGITFECKTPFESNRNEAIKEMKDILDRLNLLPYIIEENKEVSNAYMIQFPELDVKYTDEEKEKIYYMIFRFLLDSVNENRKTITTKKYIMDFKDIYIKQTIIAYVRSSVNRYKVKVEDLLNNIEYRSCLEVLFTRYVDEYLRERLKTE